MRERIILGAVWLGLLSDIGFRCYGENEWDRQKNQASAVWKRKTPSAFNIQYACFDTDGNGQTDLILEHSTGFVSPRGGMPSYTRRHDVTDASFGELKKSIEQDIVSGYIYRIK